MPQELVYTSAPRGLRPGSSGFCTVADTPDMSASLRQQLELLSVYRHVEGLGKQDAPVAYSLLQVRIGASAHLVLSRVADAGLDYSRRSNMLAHHLVLDPRTQRNTDPAWLLIQPDLFRTDWNEEPRQLDPREMRAGESECGECVTWKELTTDPGWAGVLAASADDKQYDETAVIFRPSMDTKRLVLEALQLMPASKQWKCTFSTYYTQLPPGVTCRWRFVLEGSEEARAAVRRAKTLVIDLCKWSSPDVSTNDKRAGDGLYTWYARHGERRYELEAAPPTVSTQDDLSAMDPPVAGLSLLPLTPFERRRVEKKKSSSRLISLLSGLAVVAVMCFVALSLLLDYRSALPLPPPPGARTDANRLQIDENKNKLQASVERWQQELESQNKGLAKLRPQAEQFTESIRADTARINDLGKDLVLAETEFNDSDQPQVWQSILERARSDEQSLRQLVSQRQGELQTIEEQAAAIRGELDRISTASSHEFARHPSEQADFKELVDKAHFEARRISQVVVEGQDLLTPGVDGAEAAKTMLVKLEQKLRANETAAMEIASAKSQPFKDWGSTHFTLPPARSGFSADPEAPTSAIGSLHGTIPPGDVKLLLLGDVLGSGIVFALTDAPSSAPDTCSWKVVSKTKFVEDQIATISYSQSVFRFYWSGNHGQSADERQLCNAALLLSVGDEQKTVMLRTPITSEARLAFLKPPLMSFEAAVQNYPRKCEIGVELSLQKFQIGVSDPTVRIIIPSDQESVEAVKLKELAAAASGQGELYGLDIRPDTLDEEEISDIRAGESCRWVRQTIDSMHFHLEVLLKEISPTESKPAPKRLALIARLTPNVRFFPELDKRLADLNTFQEVQSDVRKRLDSDRSSLADLPVKFQDLKTDLVRTQKDTKDNLKLLNDNYLIEKGRLEQSIDRGTEKSEFLEKAIPLLQQLETQGQLHGRVFARYKSHEIDLADFTGKSRVDGATTNPQ